MCHPKCEIQWVDDHGNATPDQNPAVGEVTLSIKGETLAPKPICAEHLKRMPTKEAYRIRARIGGLVPNPNDGWTFKPY
jgi:hypothetical protein